MTVELDEYDDVNADVAERLVKLTDEVIGFWTDGYSIDGRISRLNGETRVG